MSKASTTKMVGNEGKKITSELFSLTYGALVTQLIKDLPDIDNVNRQLDKMGYNIGLRLVDDFLAKNPQVGKCNDLREVADVLAKHGCRTYLGVVPNVSNWSAAGDEFSLVFDSNPMTEFVELPLGEQRHLAALNYCQMICGAIRGALEMLHMEVVCSFVQDQLKGDHNSEVRIKFIRKLEESVPAGDED